MSYESTTSGKSYPYNIPPVEYRMTATTNTSCYKDLNEYGPCKGASIIAPTPVSVIPPIFYDIKPHKFEVNYPKNYIMSYSNAQFARQPTDEQVNQSQFFSVINNPQNFSPYTTITQTPYSGGGWTNEKYPTQNNFKLGFNDISNFY